MRTLERMLTALAVIFLFGVPLRAQTKTTVTATVHDPRGIPYSFSTVSLQLLPSGVSNPTVGGLAIGGYFQTSLDANGVLSADIFCNSAGGGCTAISPSGTQWQFTICNPGLPYPMGFGSQCFATAITITGATQDVSATLNAIAPLLTRFPGLQNFSGPPTGSCAAGRLAVDGSTGILYTCSSGSWAKAVTSSGAGPPTGTCSGNQVYLDTLAGVLYTCSGTAWISSTAGVVSVFSGSFTATNPCALGGMLYVSASGCYTTLAAAVTVLPANGGSIYSGGLGTLTISAPVAIPANSRLISDWGTTFQPGTSSNGILQFSNNSALIGIHIDTTNQASYSGSAISNASTAISALHLEHILVKNASGSTGPCLEVNATSPSAFMEFTDTQDFTCYAGTASDGFYLHNSGGGWINGNQFHDIHIFDAKYGFHLVQAGTAAISSNFVEYNYEADSLATALAGVYVDATGHNGGNDLSHNHFLMNDWDQTVGNYAVQFSAGSANYACGNKFIGKLPAISYSDGTCAALNQFSSLDANIGTQNIFGYTKIPSPGTFTVGSGLGLTSTGPGGALVSSAYNLPTLTIKKGSGSGNYTFNTNTNFAVVDATNLCYTVTIPVGWKLSVVAAGDMGSNTGITAVSAAISDNASCSTANAGILNQTSVTGVAAAVTESFTLPWQITGDGNTHNIALQFKTSNTADAVTMTNSAANFTPVMSFRLEPSN